MKKLLFITTLIAITSTLEMGCSKNKLQDCNDLASAGDAAYYQVSLYPTQANCKAYQKALSDFLKCPALSAQEKASYQQIFSQLTC